MSRPTFVFALLLPLATASLGAQYVERPYYRIPGATLPAFQITPYAGYMDWGRYVNGPLGSHVPFANGPVLGAQASLSLTRYFAFYGELAYAYSNMGGYGNINNQGFLNSANSGAWIYDGGIQLMAPFRSEDRHWIVPFVQFGAGGINYRLNDGFNPEKSDTRFAWNGGVGLDYHFTRQVGVRLMAKDYIAMFNVPGEVFVTPGGTSVQSTKQTNNNNFTFSAGLNIGF